MAEIQRYPIVRHLRAEPSFHILRFRRGKLVASGRGLAFWFRPLNTSVAEIPMDDRELPFLFHGRAKDFQDTTVQGVITFRVVDPERAAQRVDFALDLATGATLKQPLEKLAGLLTDLAQQFALGYLAQTELRHALAEGVEEIRERIWQGLREDTALETMGLEVVAVRVGAVKPVAEVEKALQIPVREAIQQEADEATFRRRAEAVEKERAIQENELQNQIELTRREANLIEQRGENEKKRVTDEAEAARIGAEAEAERTGIGARAQAESIEAVEEAKVKAEQDRMEIYRNFPTERLLGLAAQRLAGKLQKIEHLNLTPDLMGVPSTWSERLGRTDGRCNPARGNRYPEHPLRGASGAARHARSGAVLPGDPGRGHRGGRAGAPALRARSRIRPSVDPLEVASGSGRSQRSGPVPLRARGHRCSRRARRAGRECGEVPGWAGGHRDQSPA
jgi:regulator of protease activity HflC (stomatin/prohibitin superfamily)